MTSLPENGQNGSKIVFFAFFEKKNFIIFSWKKSKIKNNVVIYISLQPLYLIKFWFSSYGPKCSQPIRLQDSLKCNISRKERGSKMIFFISRNIKFPTS